MKCIQCVVYKVYKVHEVYEVYKVNVYEVLVSSHPPETPVQLQLALSVLMPYSKNDETNIDGFPALVFSTVFDFQGSHFRTKQKNPNVDSVFS